MTNKNKKKRNRNKRGKQMRQFVEAGGQKCMEFFRHLASSQQWREHGTLPPLSNDEALILNHMYQVWLNQSPEEKEGFLRLSDQRRQKLGRGGGNQGNEQEGRHERDFRDSLQHTPLPLPLLPHSSEHASACTSAGESVTLPKHAHAQSPFEGLDPADSSQSVSVSLCISTIKNSLAQHEQYSDSLFHLVGQLDVLVKAPEPTRTHANDLLVMLLSPDFIHRDTAALEQRVDLVSTLQQKCSPGTPMSKELQREREVHLAVASACCILLALLAESEHLITERYKASLPPPFQRIIEQHAEASSSSGHEESADVKRLYDDIATSYYLRSLTIAYSPPIDGGDCGKKQGQYQDGSSTAASSCGGRNSIAAMQLGSKHLRGGVEQGAQLSQQSDCGDKDEAHSQAVLACEQEYRQAFQWFLQAALLENPIAQHKVGYFYDEGLPLGACEVHIMEAVKWYSRAAELMPDSMHNLAKIYEDGRGGFQADLKQAVTLYSVAAARGFPLSQVNLGRLFLLGEDGVQRDREAGKRLLTLAAESGDADAQMVVGMIHATPAFECYDLALSEHWLRCSMAGGKQDAERLLGRVRQQIQQQQQQQQQHQVIEDDSTTNKILELENKGSFDIAPPQQQCQLEAKPVNDTQSSSQVQLAQAAKQRGEDFLAHGLLHAAVLEFSRAFELDRSCLGYFVDRLETLFLLGHYEECLSDSSLLLDCVDANGEKLSGPQSSLDNVENADKAIAMKRLFNVLSECLSCMFSGCGRDKSGRAKGSSKESGLPENFITALPSFHRDALIRSLLVDCMELSEDSQRGTPRRGGTANTPATQGLGAARASAFLARLSLLDVKGNRSIVRNGAVPILLSVLNTVCQSIWKTSTLESGPSSMKGAALIDCTNSSGKSTAAGYAPSSGQMQYAFVREQLWLNCLVTFQHLLNPPMVAFAPPPISGDIDEIKDQEDRHVLLMKEKKLQKRRNVVHLISATDGFSTLADCVTACLQTILNTAASSRQGSKEPDSVLPSLSTEEFADIDILKDDYESHDGDEDSDEGRKSSGEPGRRGDVCDGTPFNKSRQLQHYHFRDCIALTRTTTTIMQILHCTSTVADGEHLWPELLRGGLVRTCSSSITSSVLTAQLQLEVLRRGLDLVVDNPNQEKISLERESCDDSEEAPPPLPVLLKEGSLELPVASTFPQDSKMVSNHHKESSTILPFHLQVAHICIALRHLAHTVQAAEQLLKGAPLEVLLSLSASNTMAALYQILSMLTRRAFLVASPEVKQVQAKVPDSSPLHGLAAAVYRNLLAVEEPMVSATSNTTQNSSVLEVPLVLTTSASSMLDLMEATQSAQVLTALLLPARMQPRADGTNDVQDEVKRLSSRLCDMSPSYLAAFTRPGGGSNFPSRSDGDEGNNIVQSLHSLVETTAELKDDAASCLCALLCARDPRNGELLRVNFAPDRLDQFLWLVNQQK